MYQEFLGRFAEGRSGRLLDMGCGLGFFVKKASALSGWQAYGCEISPAAVRYGRETLGLPNIVCSRLESVDLPTGSFDILTLWDVLDHILHPDPLLRRCHSLLTEDGFLFIRTPNVQVQLARARVNKLIRGMKPGIAYLQARDHTHHYSTSSLRTLLERNGFRQIEFVHLRPVRSHEHAPTFQRVAKDLWFEGVRTLAAISGGTSELRQSVCDCPEGC